MEKQLKELTKTLLADSQVDLIIGYGKQFDDSQGPIFITTPEESDALVWNNHCVHNLAVYLTKDFVKKAKRVGIVAKGCDIKAIIGLIQENQISRKKVLIIAMVCQGIGEPQLKKCASCDVKNPHLYDHLIGDMISSESKEVPYTDVKEFAKKSDSEKHDFWGHQFAKCIKCYACRAVCPLCYCQQCITDKNQPQWIATSSHLSGNFTWNFMRSFHLAGRCVACGECERVCPVGIPLTLTNRKLILEVKDNFEYTAGYETEREPPLTCFTKEDHEEFIR